MSMSRKLRLLYAILSVLLVIGLSLLLTLNAAVRSFILDPIVEGINAVRYLLGYAPQDLQWLAVLAVAAVVAASYFVARLPKKGRPEPRRLKQRFPAEGPIMKLARMLDKSPHSKYRREETVLRLRDLAARSIAYHHGISLEAATESLDGEDWIDDSSVRSLLAMERHAGGADRQNRFLDRVDYALAQIERTYSGGYHGTEESQ